MIRARWLAMLLVVGMVQTSTAQHWLDIRRMADASANAWNDESATAEVAAAPNGEVWAGNLRMAQQGVVVWNIDGVALGGRNGDLLGGFRQSMTTEINLLAAEFQLTDEQREKLVLAGQRDIVRISEQMMITPELAAGADLNQAINGMRNAQRMIKAGVFADNTMVAKVAGRILAGADASSKQQSRIRYAFQSMMRLIVAELDLVVPLNKQQRSAIDDWVDEVEPPESMSLDQMYLVALDTLRNAAVIAEVLTPTQQTKLGEMRQRIAVGAVKPTGMIKSRRTMASSMRKRRSP